MKSQVFQAKLHCTASVCVGPRLDLSASNGLFSFSFSCTRLDKYKNKQRPEQKQQQYRGAREEKQTKGNKGGRGVEGEGAQRGTHVAAAGQFPKRAAGISHSNNNIRTINAPLIETRYTWTAIILVPTVPARVCL